METPEGQIIWEDLSYKEKNHQLYLRQKKLLDTYLRTGAISQEQHDKSLHDLTEKMGYSNDDDEEGRSGVGAGHRRMQ